MKSARESETPPIDPPQGPPAIDPPQGPWRAEVSDTDGWTRLDPRTVTASTIAVGAIAAASAVPVAIGLTLGGVGPGWILLWTVVGVLLTVVGTAIVEGVRLAVTRYRVATNRIDRRVRFLSSTTNSISTGRVRNVEISADLVQRRLGIATVKLASGETDGSRLTLAALDRSHAEELRTHILAERASAETTQLARLDPGWVRYAPASLMTPILGLAGFGVVFQVASWFNAVPAMIDWVWDRIGTLPWPLIGAGLLAVAVVIGVLAAIAIFVENWWGMRLDQHRDGSLELRRGALVGRHTSFDGSRIRGITLYEPPGFRVLGAARLDVVATGVGTGTNESGKKSQSPALLPGSPRDVPAEVAESILGEPVPTQVHAHPLAARRRRAVRALVAIGLLTLAALAPAFIWTWLWWIPVMTAVLGGCLAPWIVVDNYRGLGHMITEYVVALRKGSVLRRTDVLRRDGLLGWNVRRTPFQKRAGLVTMVATSAGGSGAFRLPDVAEADVARLQDSAGAVWDHLRRPHP